MEKQGEVYVGIVRERQMESKGKNCREEKDMKGRRDNTGGTIWMEGCVRMYCVYESTALDPPGWGEYSN